MHTTGHNAYQVVQQMEHIEPQIPLINTAIGNIYSGLQAIPNIIRLVDSRVQNIQQSLT